MKKISLVLLVLCAIATPSMAADTDACTLLTAAQVGAAIGTAVGQGSHVTPTFVKTCTWQPSAKSSISAVTLNMQTAATYDGGKQQLAMAMAATSSGAKMIPASVGDDAYYFVTGDQVGLLVKKGGASFKVAVYAKIPVADKQAMELKLAKDVLGKL